MGAFNDFPSLSVSFHRGNDTVPLPLGMRNGTANFIRTGAEGTYYFYPTMQGGSKDSMNCKPGDIICGTGEGGSMGTEKTIAQQVELLEQNNKNLVYEVGHLKSLHFNAQLERNEVEKKRADAEQRAECLQGEIEILKSNYRLENSRFNVHMWEQRVRELEYSLSLSKLACKSAEEKRDLYHADLKVSGENNKKLRKEVAEMKQSLKNQAIEEYSRENAKLRQEKDELKNRLINISSYCKEVL